MKRYYYITPEDEKVAAENGISYYALWNRVRNLGWDVDRSITQPIQAQKSKKKWLDVARKNGLPDHVFYDRVRCGWGEEAAATEPKMSRKKVASKASHSRERPYTEEQVKRAERNGISRRQLWHRIQKQKWNVERAITEPIWTQDDINKNIGKQENYFRRLHRADWEERQADV